MIGEESKKQQVDELLGQIVADRYLILRPLGVGGMGSVHLAQDLILDEEEVAIKILHHEHSGDDVTKQRFLREAELLRRVNHNNVVRLFDVGSWKNVLFYTMEFLPGRSLEQIIEREQFPIAKVPELIIQIAEGLDAIHQCGIIHRDLKPANIIVQEGGGVKITDFGIARTESSNLTQHNEIIGSVFYIAPENWQGREITRSVDYYSLGIVLYELLTGELPFQADSAAKLMRLHLEVAPVPPRDLNPAIPLWLNKFILKLLSKSPLDRPQTVQDIVDEVRQKSRSMRGEVDPFDENYSSFLSALEHRWGEVLTPAPAGEPPAEESSPRVESEAVDTSHGKDAPSLGENSAGGVLSFFRGKLSKLF
jgi:serine/threonine-protein kinase